MVQRNITVENDPQPKQRRRWPWVVLSIILWVAVAAAFYIPPRILPWAQTKLVALLAEAGITAEIEGSALSWEGVTAEAVTLKREELAWRIEDFSVRPAFDERAAVIKIGRIEQTEGKILHQPLSLDLVVGFPENSVIHPLEGQVRDYLDRARINVKGTFNRSTKEAMLDLDLEEVTFETGLLQPDQLVPALRGNFTNVEGAIHAQSHIEYHADQEPAMQGNAVLHLKKISGMIGSNLIADMNGMVVFDSLSPLTTPPDQVIEIGMLTAGLPLRNGAIQFDLDADGTLRIAPTRWSLAGGHIMTDKFTLNTGSFELNGLTLRADALSLEELMSGVLQSGFSASGSVSGKVPVTIKAGAPSIHNATLSAGKGGTIKYTPPADGPLQKGQAIHTDILLQALENFQYEELSLKLNSEAADNLVIDLRLKGSNPELYDGQAIELNVHLTGDILGLVQSGLNVYNLPERLQEQWLNGQK